MTVKKRDVLKILEECKDPEVGESIVDLGMIDEIEIKNGEVLVKLLPTSLMCPMLGVIMGMVKEKLMSMEGVNKVEVELVKDKMWTPDRMSERLKKKFGVE